MDFSSLVSTWDKQIRDGMGAILAEEITALSTVDVPERHRPHVAAIARRLGLLKFGLDLLREDYLARRQNVLDHEVLMVEYAALLTEIGATQISERLFCQFEKPSYAKTYFYRALLWIKKWEHEKAVRDLRQFKQAIDDPYWHVMADLNLLGSLVFLRQLDSAQDLMESLEARAKSLSPMASGILAELKGQLLFFSGHTESARTHFERSHESLKGAHNSSLLFTEKWLLIVNLLTQPWDQVESQFRVFQERARHLGYWEVLRELDRFYAIRFNDEKVLAKLYFGSPAEGYRNMICRDLRWTPPPEYFHNMRGSSGRILNFLDVQTLALNYSGKLVTRIAPSSLRLLRALTHDLYRPSAVGSLFEQVYHGDFFDPDFAGARIHQAIRRFRKFTDDQNVPLRVTSTGLGFILIPEVDFSIRYTRLASEDIPIARLREAFGATDFTAADVASLQSLSQRTVNRFLAPYIKGGDILKSGTGRNTKYRLKRAA